MAVTSKELAEAAGVAEGTLFKAFGTKDDLLRALAGKHAAMPDAVGEWLRTIDPERMTLRELVIGIIGQAAAQYQLSFQLFYALGPLMDKPNDEAIEQFERELEPWTDALAPHANDLRIQADAAAAILRMYAVAVSDQGSAWGPKLSAESYADIFLNGAATSGAQND